MKAVNFEEQNGELGNGLPGYYNVPMYKADNAVGDVIMKIQMTKEQWEEIGKNDFSFWYTRQVGESGLQPFSFQTDSPFVKLYGITDLSPETLEALLQAGTKFRNNHVGRDIDIIEIMSVKEGMVAYRLLNAYGSTEETKMCCMLAFSEFLLSSEFADQFLIIHPKQ